MLLVVAVSLLVFFSATYVSISSILNASYKSIEGRDIEQRLDKTMVAYEHEEANLRTILIDYTNWDDTYEFISQKDPEYLESNFVLGTFINLHLDDVVIIDDQGELLFAYHLQNDTLVPSSQDLLNMTVGPDGLQGLVGNGEGISGLVRIGDDLTMFSCRRAFHSDGSGPGIGFIWFSRTVDDYWASNMKDLTSYDVLMEPYDDGALHQELGEKGFQDLVRNGYAVVEDGDDRLRLYSLVSDVYGQPTMVITSTMGRDVFLFGKETMELVLYSIIVASMIFLVIIYFSVGLAIKRVEGLEDDVNKIYRDPKDGQRVRIEDKQDEISSLGRSINIMLENLEMVKKDLEEKEALFRSVLRDQTEMIVRFDPELNITFGNESYFKFVNGGPRSKSGQSLTDHVLPIDLDKLLNAIRGLKKDETVGPLDIRSLDRNGDLRWHAWTIRSVVKNGSVSEYQAVARDVTEQKLTDDELKKYRESLEEMVKERTAELMKVNEVLAKEIEKRRAVEKDLKMSQRRYQAVIEDQTELIVRTSPDGSINFMNKAFSRFFGLENGKDAKQPFAQNIVDEDREKYDKFIEGLDIANPSGMIEYKVLVNGKVHWLQWTYRKIFDAEGSLTEVQGVGRDITELKKLQNERLQTANLESLGLLAGGMAHEFNNLLTIVLGNISLIRSSPAIDEGLRDRLESTERSIRAGYSLTESILTFSSGGEPLMNPIPAVALIKDVISDVSFSSSIILKLDYTEDVWDIQGDRGQLRQALRAIVVNAKEAVSKGGEVVISATNVLVTEKGASSIPPGRYVRIDITDNGIGIADDDLPHIFDPYYSTKRSKGLGLTYALSIVKRHHGNILVESGLGIGSKFSVFLLASDEVHHDEGPGPVKEGGARILLMDDEEDILEVTGELLSVHGYEVGKALDGEGAIAEYERAKKEGRPYDLVIMDLTIKGGMGGKEAISKLRMLDPGVRAIVSSGYSTDPVMAKYREFGFDGVVKKPYTIIEMVAEIQRVLGHVSM